MQTTKHFGSRLLSLIVVFALLLSMTFVSANADTIKADELTKELESAVILDTVFTGAGTEASPYQITSEKDLVMLQLLSNGVGSDTIQTIYAHGNSAYFELTSDITLTTAWTPIAGTAENYFAGTFNGGSHTISGLSVEETAEAGAAAYAGLFGYIKDAEVKNLTVSGSVTLSVSAGESTGSTTQAYVGGVVAYALDSAVENCTANVTVTASNADTGTVDLVAGGVIGYIGASSSTASASVSNSAAAVGTQVTVTTSASGDGIATVAGGVVGLNEAGTVSGCNSAAAVNVSGSETEYALEDYTVTGQFSDTRTIKSDLNMYYYSNVAGGVVGAAVGLYTVDYYSESTGVGAGQSQTLYATVSKSAAVGNCTSTATVTNSSDSSVASSGGVIGTALFADVSAGTYCGTVSAVRVAGGIIGIAAGDNSISDCTVKTGASITATSDDGYAGGIAAELGSSDAGASASAHSASTVSGCSVESGTTVQAGAYAGGIIGYITYADSITNCVNRGIVTAVYGAGGIVAFAKTGIALDGCSNYGDVTATGSTDAATSSGIAAGIIALPVTVSGTNAANSASCTISDCLNEGNITGTLWVGGIAAYCPNASSYTLLFEISGCVNKGTITINSTTGSSRIGGIAGYFSNGGLYNCANYGSVTGSAEGSSSTAGGIVGSAVTGSYILNSYNAGNVFVTVPNSGGIAGRENSYMINVYNVGTVTDATTGRAISGAGSANGVLVNCFALTGTAEDLYFASGSPTVSNVVFFDENQNITSENTSFAEITALIDALNSSVGDAVSTYGYLLCSWAASDSDSYAYPVFGEVIPVPQAPSAPTVQLTDETIDASSIAPASQVELSASCETESVQYQWYVATSESGSDKEAIESATESTYTVDTSAVGTLYYFVSAKVVNTYGVSSDETFSAAFAVTVVFTPEENGDLVYDTVTISLKDSSSGAVNSKENPYIIDSPEKLEALSTMLSSDYPLGALYFEQTTNLDIGSMTDWTPIGTSSNQFAGTYNGGGYTVTVSISSENDGVALFGYSSGTIENLTLNGSVCTSGFSAAGVVYQSSGTVQNCTNNASVESTVTGNPDNHVGGIAGYAASGAVIYNCVNTGAVAATSKNAYVGGVVGYTSSGVDVRLCANSGTITGDSTTGSQAGGLVGNSGGQLLNCSNSGSVSGYYAGGLAGGASGDIVNCYNTGSVSGTRVGGLAGRTSRAVYNCYSAAASVSGNTSYTGALVGYLQSGGGVSNCFFLSIDELSAIGNNKGSASSLGSFDSSETVTALEDYTLDYSGSLTNQLLRWAVDHQSEYDLLGWAEQENGYPVLSADVELSELASAAAAVALAESNVSETDKDTANVTLSASVTLVAADVGTVTYTWYMDGEAVASGDITETLKSSGTASVSVTVDTHTAGVHVYSLTVENAGEYTTASTTVSTTVKVNKPSDDTSWYGDWDIASSFADGSGTESDPYQISSADELAYLAQEVNAGSEDVSGKYFVLTADIDLNSYTWTPIGTSSNRFTGVFDGDGHTVSEIATSSDSNYQGLFGYVGDATIKNLVVSGEVEGTSIVGGIVAYAAGALTLENCGNEADVTGSSRASAGGLVGEAVTSEAVTIASCYNTGAITGTSSSTNGYGIGGLVGFVNAPISITDSYNLGSVINSGNYMAGGLVGQLNLGFIGNYISSYTFENCYNAGYVQSGYSYEYALIGAYYYTEGAVSTTNCYYLTGTARGDDTDASAVGFITASMLGSAFTDVGSAATFDFSHATVSINGAAVESGAAVAAAYPALAWETDPQRDAASVTFTVTADDDYGVYSVQVGDTELTANDDGSYTVAVDEDITVTVNVKRVSWSGENDAANDIESIIASDAAGTESEDDENSTYDSSLDLNNDGKNDLLDILDILYTESTQSEDSASESTDESADSEETAAKEPDETETDSSDTATESAESTEG